MVFVKKATEMLDGQPVTIQVPQVQRNRIDIASGIDDGGSLLIGIQPRHVGNEPKQGIVKHFYVLITAQQLKDEDLVTRK